MVRSLSLLLALSLATACAHGAGASAGEVDASPAAPAVPAEIASTPRPAVAAEQAPVPAAPPGAEAAAPASGSTPPIARQAPIALESARERLVRAARRYVGRRFRGDCSHFVLRVFSEAQVPLPPLRPERTMSESLYRALSPVARPQPGDLAFFHDTRGPGRSRRTPRRFTHVAIVEDVDGPRVTLIDREGRGIRRLAMNLARPHDAGENGILRRRRARDRRGTRYLTGELFAGYASALGGDLVARAGSVPHGPDRLPRGLLDRSVQRTGQSPGELELPELGALEIPLEEISAPRMHRNRS